MGCWSAAALSLAFLVVLLVLNFGGAQGKRGCASFGHSCYGGMGKRALDVTSANDETIPDNEFPNDSELIFTGARTGGYNPYPQQKLSLPQYEQLSRILRQWIQSHRRPQPYERDENLI